jgi:NTP pyrophosphatase (non-canonical NTP hydrolase)
VLEHRGLVKLMEECGELIQVAAKKITRMDSDDHWDGAGSLACRLQTEMGDVLAAITVVKENFGLDDELIMLRAESKVALFRTWMAEDVDAPVLAQTSPSEA